MNAILNTIVQQIKNISILLYPIIPDSSKKVLNTINIDDKKMAKGRATSKKKAEEQAAKRAYFKLQSQF